MEVKSKRINAINHGIISETIDDIFDGNSQAKRISSLSNATQGAITRVHSLLFMR